MALPRGVATHNFGVRTMTYTQFQTQLSTVLGASNSYSHPLLPRNRVDETAWVLPLSPIPAFLVYDGFQGDLDAAEVYERVLSVENHNTPMFRNLKSFLRSSLGGHNVGDVKPYVDPLAFMAQPPPEAKVWATSRFKSHFPTLQPAPPPPPPAAAVGGGNNPPTMAELLAQILPHLNGAGLARPGGRGGGAAGAGAGPAEEKKDDGDPSGSMDPLELTATLRMCGLPATGSSGDLPPWFTDIQGKALTDQFHLNIVRAHLTSHTHYDDAEVPMTTPLLKMLIKRAWVGKDGNIKRPSLLHATDGLSPFICQDLDEDAVAMINEDETALTSASHVTFQDLKSYKKYFKAVVPTDAADFMLLLKRFANLLFATFSGTCPYFLAVTRIIDALKEFSPAARSSLSLRSKASILWIILLQGRTFATGDVSILAEFDTMHSNLCAKLGNISHAEVPAELISPKDTTSGTKRSALPPEDAPPKDTKKAKLDSPNPNNWNTKLQKALAGPLKTAGDPSFQQVAKFCNKPVGTFYNLFKDCCTPNAVLGKCYMKEKCVRPHRVATDTEADQVLSFLEPLIANPSGLSKG